MYCTTYCYHKENKMWYCTTHYYHDKTNISTQCFFMNMYHYTLCECHNLLLTPCWVTKINNQK